jgi:hypothetical protein
MPRAWIRWSTRPGSTVPERVPIISPPRVVNPIVVATLRPSATAQRLAPWPRWATTIRPFAVSPINVGSIPTM